MKPVFMLLAVSCWLSAVSAQWLETTIDLPDSFKPHDLCYNSRDNKVYCANVVGSSVAVIDGATNEGSSRFRVGDLDSFA